MKRKKHVAGSVRGQLTVDILRQLGVSVSQSGHLVGGILELVGHLGELFVGRPEVRTGGGQVSLQLHHLRLKRCLS
jgi:hypothetical protein